MSIKDKMQEKLVASLRKTKKVNKPVEAVKKAPEVKAKLANKKPATTKNKVANVKKAAVKPTLTFISASNRVWPD